MRIKSIFFVFVFVIVFIFCEHIYKKKFFFEKEISQQTANIYDTTYQARRLEACIIDEEQPFTVETIAGFAVNSKSAAAKIHQY